MQYKLQCHEESLFNAFISYFSLKQFLEEHILKFKQIWRAFKKNVWLGIITNLEQRLFVHSFSYKWNLFIGFCSDVLYSWTAHLQPNLFIQFTFLPYICYGILLYRDFTYTNLELSLSIYVIKFLNPTLSSVGSVIIKYQSILLQPLCTSSLHTSKNKQLTSFLIS